MENLKTLNKNTKKSTKKAQGFIHSYEYYNKKSSSYDIETFYQRPSYSKIRAWDECKKLCTEHNGKGLCITGGNSSYFSAGFTFKHANKNYLCYITYANNYYIELD